jgi:N-acetyl-gamma-glutamyl-phosphate reductase
MIRAAIVGASGYSGAELLRILSRHADVTVATVTANTSVGQRVDALYPDLTGTTDLVFEEFRPDAMATVDVAFVALPSGQGMAVVPGLLGRAARVIDLGGDFRLKSTAAYERYYGHPHTAPELLREAVYGLPELNRTAIAGARLVANPGCYATSVILALLPALVHGLVSPAAIAVSAVSGISGAGRTSSVELSFSELNENVRAYKVGVHQHVPEIEAALRDASGQPATLSFIPHLVPITRGIYATVHAALATEIGAEKIAEVYQEYYRTAPFVRVRKQVPQIQAVARTNYCDIALSVDRRTGQLVVLSTIDNLVKGAAGQAVQNMNMMFGLPEEKGLRWQ